MGYTHYTTVDLLVVVEEPQKAQNPTENAEAVYCQGRQGGNAEAQRTRRGAEKRRGKILCFLYLLCVFCVSLINLCESV